MKLNRSFILALGLLILCASLYRVWDARPYGFAPQIAMAIFGGAIIRNKLWAFILPILSMFISDTFYQVLYVNGLSPIKGFYDGQWLNYILFSGLTVIGFLLKKINTVNILGFSISGSIFFFITSNFAVWAGGGGFQRPKTFEGLLQCYGDALAFYREFGLVKGFAGNLFLGDLFFCTLLFGTFYLAQRYWIQGQPRFA
jgi:hypothetical protein